MGSKERRMEGNFEDATGEREGEHEKVYRGVIE